jgi:hypothetical protein
MSQSDSPAEVVEAAEDRGMSWLLPLLAANNTTLPTLLQVGSNLGARVILQERLPRLLQLLHLPPVLQHRAGDTIWYRRRQRDGYYDM